MHLLALGLNHRTAAVDLRERTAFSPEQLPGAVRSLISSLDVAEATILSTCNRTEIYCRQQDLSSDPVLHWLRDYGDLPVQALDGSTYVLPGEQAVQHAFRVASGLDSMVLGEPQILGQMKDAWQAARTAGTLGPYLDRLFQSTFNMAKQVRTDTAIGENPVSVAFAAVSLARQIFADLRRSTALLIGAGETIALVARHLFEQGVGRIIVANRTLQRAELLSEPLGGQAIVLTQIPDILAECDVVISSTASPLPMRPPCQPRPLRNNVLRPR